MTLRAISASTLLQRYHLHHHPHIQMTAPQPQVEDAAEANRDPMRAKLETETVIAAQASKTWPGHLLEHSGTLLVLDSWAKKGPRQTPDLAQPQTDKDSPTLLA